MSNMLRGSLTSTTDAKGVLGFKGERGYSAYEIAVKNGYQGTEQEWIDHFGLDLTDYVKTSDVLDLVYPVGSLYMSVNSTSPATLFGGTWIQIKDKFLLSAGDNYTAGNTGGEATHTLTTDEIPSHSHRTKWKTGSQTASSSVIAWEGSSTSWQYVSTEATGGGQAHNNMPPYLVVYVWKRTA